MAETLITIFLEFSLQNKKKIIFIEKRKSPQNFDVNEHSTTHLKHLMYNVQKIYSEASGIV